MTRLSSSGLTLWYRIGAPLTYLVSIAVVRAKAPGITGLVTVAVIASLAFTLWYGWRMSDVWLDGDALQVKRLSTFRVPLSNVTGIDIRQPGRAPTVFVLGFDQPVGTVRQVRFLPAKGIEKDLRARIHAARAARTT